MPLSHDGALPVPPLRNRRSWLRVKNNMFALCLWILRGSLVSLWKCVVGMKYQMQFLLQQKQLGLFFSSFV